MVLVKKLKTYHIFLFGKRGQLSVFDDIPVNKELNKSKTFFFQRGYSPWFRSKKLKIFHLFLLGILGQGNVFDDILERKKSFLYYNKKEFKNMKNWNISKQVTPWFLSKN